MYDSNYQHDNWKVTTGDWAQFDAAVTDGPYVGCAEQYRAAGIHVYQAITMAQRGQGPDGAGR